MKRDLILIRHAKSSWKEQGVNDHERTLNKRGKHDAPLMAEILRHKMIFPDLLLSSTAVRARTTAELFAKVYDIKKSQIQLSDDLYLADEMELLNEVKKISSNFRSVFLFAHNPGITDFANALCKADIVNIPTCGYCHARFDTDDWNSVEFGDGIFVEYDYPKKHYPA